MAEYSVADAETWGREDAEVYKLATPEEQMSFWRFRSERMGASPINHKLCSAYLRGLKEQKPRESE